MINGVPQMACKLWTVGMLAVAFVGGSGSAAATEDQDLQERLQVREQLSGSIGFLNPIAFPHEDAIAAQCIIWGDMAILLAPRLTPLQVEDFVSGLPPLDNRRYQFQGDYWPATATDGPVSLPGQRITLTWSFVPDGTMILRHGGGGSLPSTLFSTLTPLFGTDSAWQNRFRQSFTEYGNLIGVNYVEVSDDGASQPAFGQVGLRGDIRIAMIDIDGPGEVLAFNYFPTSPGGRGGDMVLDSGDAGSFRNPANANRFFRNVITHEHGHGIGLRHVEPVNGTKLMEPNISTNYTSLQEDDIRAAQHVHGDWLEANSTPETATELAPLPTTPGSPALVFQNLAIERSTAVDYFRFTAPAFRALNIRVEPVGTTYSQGPQGGTPSFINAAATQDLAIDLLTGNNSQVLATLNNTPAGQMEEGLIPLPDEGGEFLFRIRSAAGTSESQRYRLTVSLTPVEPPASVVESLAIY